MKLVAIELECQRYNRELQDCKDKLKEASKTQDTTKTYMIIIALYLNRLKNGFIDSLYPSPIERGVWSSSPKAITTTFELVFVVITTILGVCRLNFSRFIHYKFEGCHGNLDDV